MKILKDEEDLKIIPKQPECKDYLWWKPLSIFDVPDKDPSLHECTDDNGFISCFERSNMLFLWIPSLKTMPLTIVKCCPFCGYEI